MGTAVRHDGHGLRVLYVEDDPDVQEMLRFLLEAHGYEVKTVGSAGEGLHTLRSERFHLVIADYNLPDEDGATMLAKAAEEGCLHCESLILTGAYSLGSHATAYRVVRKPIDAASFLAKLDVLLAPVREDELARARAALEQPNETGASNTDRAPAPAGERTELVLYISEASRASLRALRRLTDLLKLYDRDRLHLRIVDISKERPASFDDDRITFTPTLVKRHPGPRVYFLGALERVDDLMDVLGDPLEPRGG